MMKEELKDGLMPEDVKDVSDGAAGNGVHSNEPEKSFTQADLDAIVKERLARASKGLPAKDELAAFRKWQEEQKADASKGDDKLRKLAEYEQKLQSYEQREKVRAANVEGRFIDFVIFEANRRMNKNTDFEAALKNYLAENPNFMAGNQFSLGAGGYRQGGSGQQLSGVEAEFLKRNPDLKI